MNRPEFPPQTRVQNRLCPCFLTLVITFLKKKVSIQYVLGTEQYWGAVKKIERIKPRSVMAKRLQSN